MATVCGLTSLVAKCSYMTQVMRRPLKPASMRSGDPMVAWRLRDVCGDQQHWK
jgi:hypothetical protein